MDPGNFGTSIAAGSYFDYSLLWVVWLSSGMAMLFQYLSGKMGLAGFSLAEVIRIRWKNRIHVLIYWLMSEVAIIATDLAEFLGIVVALNLLFGIPLLIASFLSVLDVLLLFFLTRRSFRTLEYAFIFFVMVIGIGYVYETFIARPSLSGVLYGSLPLLNKEMLFIAVGMIGATVMPHALFVHSWLTKNKMKKMKDKVEREKALSFHKADTVFSLFIAALINAAILIMAAGAFYNIGTPIVTIDQAYKTLAPLFGGLASVVFAITLLSSGISSSITGTLAGQSIMESLTDFRISPVVRRLITRFINLVPIVIAILLKIDPLNILVISQVALSFLIPLPLIPLVYYTSKKEVMGGLVNRRATLVVAVVFTLLILVLNAWLLYTLILPSG